MAAETTHSSVSTTKPLSAKEVIAHPAYEKHEWNLPPTNSGTCSVARGRAGGPFDLWYEIHGSGKTKIVWIMGLGALRTAWKRQTKHFGHDNSSTYSCLIFDNRGMGRSSVPSCRYSTSEMARDVLDLLIHLSWYNPSSPPVRDLNIIGVSMGGMIAQELSLLIPTSIQSVFLVSTAPRLVRTIPFIENLRQRINMFIPRDIDVQLDEVAHRLFSAEFLKLPDTEQTDPSLNYPLIQDRFACGELHKRADKEAFTRKGFMLQAIAAGWHYKSPEQIAEIGDKVGRDRIAVLHGTVDNMLTFKHFELIKEDLGEGAEYRVWEGAGHVLAWEKETEFNELVKSVIEKTAKI